MVRRARGEGRSRVRVRVPLHRSRPVEGRSALRLDRARHRQADPDEARRVLIVPSGYSGTPLAAKLGIKPGSLVVAVHAPSVYRALLAPLPDSVRFGARLTGATDIVHVFSRERAELGRLLKAYRGKLKPTGAVWVS